jgi:hypothetical protein
MAYMTWDEACDVGGYDPDEAMPRKEYEFLAYKNGECKKFQTETEAKRYSRLVERVCTNQVQYDTWVKNRQAQEAAAHSVWYAGLEWLYIHTKVNKDVFRLCYARAYDAGHHNGRDYVAEKLGDFIDFALEVMKLNKGN